MRWVVLSTEETIRRQFEDEKWAAEEAKRRERIKACQHSWFLELEHPDDGSHVDLNCLICDAGIDDIIMDGIDGLYLYIDGESIVDAGVHKLPYPATIPVTMEVKSFHSSTPNGEEWWFEIVTDAIGPIEPLES